MFTLRIFHVRTVGRFTLVQGVYNVSSLKFYAVHSRIHEEEEKLLVIQIGTELGNPLVLTVKKP